MCARVTQALCPLEIARGLCPTFKLRADESEGDDFVAENFAALKTSGLLQAGVPVELGGRGASVDELAEMLRVIAHACGSTALTLSMHTHQVAIAAWRWKHRHVAALELLLRRVATERIMLTTSGGSDWIAGSGTAERVEGGYRITARKAFTSGAPAGDLLLTSAILRHDGEPPTCVAFRGPARCATCESAR